MLEVYIFVFKYLPPQFFVEYSKRLIFYIIKYIVYTSNECIIKS